MKVSEAINILKTENTLERTPTGRPLSGYALASINATLEDINNYHMDVIQCMGCGFVISGLLTSEGCPNCGMNDLASEIKQ